VSIDFSALMVQDELEGAGPTINGAAEIISGELATLISQLAPLNDFWQGQAYTDYTLCQQAWNTAANNLFGPDGLLGNVAQAMNISWGNYSDAEFANISSWQSG
jgi:uncharacterized protein YukE